MPSLNESGQDHRLGALANVDWMVAPTPRLKLAVQVSGHPDGGYVCPRSVETERRHSVALFYGVVARALGLGARAGCRVLDVAVPVGGDGHPGRLELVLRVESPLELAQDEAE